jgi:hypothetical protein
MHHSSNKPFYCKSKAKAMGYIHDRFNKLEELVKSNPDSYVREQKMRNLRKTKKVITGRIDVFKQIKC